MSVLDIARFQCIVRQYTLNRIESGDVVVSQVEKERGAHLVHNYELLQKMIVPQISCIQEIPYLEKSLHLSA